MDTKSVKAPGNLTQSADGAWPATAPPGGDGGPQPRSPVIDFPSPALDAGSPPRHGGPRAAPGAVGRIDIDGGIELLGVFKQYRPIVRRVTLACGGEP
jgi:hypothetical protein